MNAMKLFTLGDFFRPRYGAAPEVMASVIMIFAFTILLAGNLVACGFLLERFAGIPYAVGVVIAVLLVLAYTIGGGLFSDAYTAAHPDRRSRGGHVRAADLGRRSLRHRHPRGHGAVRLRAADRPGPGAPINWATLISLGIGDLVAIDFMQRIFGAQSPEVARRSCFIGAARPRSSASIFALVALTATAACWA